MDASRTSETGLKYGLVVPSVAELADPGLLVEYAVAAEEARWDGIFLFDHLIWPFTADPDEYDPVADPWITLAGIATRTEQITLGTWITPVPRRQPWQLARNLATLDHLSDGRVLLGAGLGTGPDFTRFGRAYDQQELGEAFDEALDVIAGLWRDEPFSYEGDHYTVDDAVMLPTPVQQPRIPIVIGGWWPFKTAFHRGARWDGIAPNWPSLIDASSVTTLEELPDHIQEAIARQQTNEEEVREMLDYYHEVADTLGEIILPTYHAPSVFRNVCKELGATWLLSERLDPTDTHTETLDTIRAGPPE